MNCWEPGDGDVGGQERYLAAHPHLCPRAHVTMTEVEPSNSTPLADTSVEHASLVPSDADDESDLREWYHTCNQTHLTSDMLPYLAFLHNTDSVILVLFATHYNAILNSGCMTHIVKYRAYFWTYHTSAVTTVSTANCGTLLTLARGEVCFRITAGGTQQTIYLRDCLYAPDVPINLLSVGSMQEKHVKTIFNYGMTIIHLPFHSLRDKGGVIDTAIIHCLSFLKYEFIAPPLLEQHQNQQAQWHTQQ